MAPKIPDNQTKLDVLRQLEQVDWHKYEDHWVPAAEILDSHGVDSGFDQYGEQWLKGQGVFVSQGYTGLTYKAHRAQEDD